MPTSYFESAARPVVTEMVNKRKLHPFFSSPAKSEIKFSSSNPHDTAQKYKETRLNVTCAFKYF